MPIAELRRIAVAYIERPQVPGDLRTSDGARGKCSTVSMHLVDACAAAGYDARRVRFKGHRHAVPVPHPEHDMREEHLAVLVDGVVIYATRRQFDPEAAVPTVYESIDDAGRDWLHVFEDEFSLTTRPLPSP